MRNRIIGGADKESGARGNRPDPGLRVSPGDRRRHPSGGRRGTGDDRRPVRVRKVHPAALRGAVGTRVPHRLAVIFQDYSRSLYPWLTVADNVALPLRRTERRAVRRQSALAAVESVGLAAFAGRYPWQLSGGMQQRVAIARALACDPVLLLMDEPFGSMDAQMREDLEDLVLRVRAERNITILLVTHDIDESVYTGDRVVVLSHGPGQVVADVPVDLPAPRDQIVTKELREFARLRAEVSRLVRATKLPEPR